MYTITVYQNASEDWNWHLQYNGKNMSGGLQGPSGFASRDGALDNLIHTARIFLAVGAELNNPRHSWTTGEHSLGTLESGVEVKLVIQQAA